MCIRDSGIRKVLGATVAGIASLLTREFLKLVLISLVVASPLAWWVMNNWLQGFAYRINIGWWMFVLAGLGAVIIAMITAPKPASTNIHQPILIRYAKPCNQLFITHQANGEATTNEIRTSFKNSRVNKEAMPATVAPSTF